MKFYGCDMPGAGGDGTCGRTAEFFHDEGRLHRPLCMACQSSLDVMTPEEIKPIAEIDPTKAPPLRWSGDVEKATSVSLDERRVPRRFDNSEEPKVIPGTAAYAHLGAFEESERAAGAWPYPSPDAFDSSTHAPECRCENVCAAEKDAAERADEGMAPEIPVEAEMALGAPNPYDVVSSYNFRWKTDRPSPPSRPPLREALADVAVMALGAIGKKISRWGDR